MPFGAQLTNQTAVFNERYIYAAWSGIQIAQGQNWQVALASMTMPFTGDILVDLFVEVAYSQTLLACQVWPATPIGPSNFWAGFVTEYNPYGGCFVVPMFGRWSNLAAGTFFDLTIQIKDIVSNGVCTINQCHGFMRAQAY
jgi:hypothetical protein